MKKWPWLAALTALAGAAVTAKLVSRPRDIEWSDYADDLPYSEHSNFVAVDGVRLHFQDLGSRNDPALILLHGFGSSTHIWADVLQPLADAGFRVIAPDLVGFGFSEKPPYAEYTIHFQARMMLRLMNRLGIGRAQFVGSSYGGAVAATCALEAPERVEKLVLVGAVSTNFIKEQGLVRLASAPLAGPVITPLLLGSKALMRWRVRQVYSPQNAHLMEDPRRQATRQRLLSSANAHHAILHSLRRWDANHISREAHLIQCPTLLVWGELDRDVPLTEARRLFQEIPDSRLIVFRECGHIPQDEYPTLFAQVVSQFLQGTLPYTRTGTVAEGSKVRKLSEDEVSELE